MYVLEHAGDFVRAHALKPDDVIGLSSADVRALRGLHTGCLEQTTRLACERHPLRLQLQVCSRLRPARPSLPLNLRLAIPAQVPSLNRHPTPRAPPAGRHLPGGVQHRGGAGSQREPGGRAVWPGAAHARRRLGAPRRQPADSAERGALHALRALHQAGGAPRLLRAHARRGGGGSSPQGAAGQRGSGGGSSSSSRRCRCFAVWAGRACAWRCSR